MNSIPNTKTMAQMLVLMLLVVVFAAGPVIAAEKININTATVEELETLPRIGAKTAAAIVEYRKAHPFKTVDGLTEVKGIGEKTLEKLRPLVTVGKKSSKSSKHE